MNLLIDSHAHLTDVAFRDDLVDVLERAALSGIDRVIAIAETLDDAERACGLARQFDMLAATAGVHPHKADSWSEQSAERLASMVSSGRFVAVGEIGLDYHYNFSDRENQKRAFVEQLRIARKSGLPVVVHCREAYDVLTEILSAETPLPAGVIHCFIGTASDARELLAMGFHIGIGGAVTFRKADRLRQIVAEVVPLNRLLLETDSPYLAPEPVRGHRNEPAHLCRIAEAVAAVKSADLARLASATRRNAMELFHLGPELPPTSIAYTLRNSLYLNITNRCTNDCVFCARTRQCALAGYELRLEREPSVAEIIAAIGEKPDTCDEVVFCGYGEPTFRREAILWVGRWLKARGVRRVRLNTNGHGNALHGRSIVGELAEVVDAVSVSLNASDEDDYRRLCQPTDARFGFDEVCRFVAEARGKIKEVVVTAVAYPSVNIEACRKLAEERLGVRFRCRPYHGH